MRLRIRGYCEYGISNEFDASRGHDATLTCGCPDRSDLPRMSDTPVTKKPAVFSIASILSIVAAIGSFMTGAIFGLILAIVAIFFGFFGVLMSLAPSRRGGIVSVLALIGGVIGIVAAVFKAILWFF